MRTNCFRAFTHVMKNDFPRYKKALLKSANIVADILISVIWLLDPSHIVIDCGYATPYQDVFADRISSCLATRMGEGTRRFPSIQSVPGGTHSILSGAAQVLEPVFNLLPALEQSMEMRNANHSFSGIGGDFVILGKAARVSEPTKRTLNYPAPGELLPFMRLDFLRNVYAEAKNLI